jgi:hypothetical protein
VGRGVPSEKAVAQADRDLGAAQDAQSRLQRAGYAGLIVRLK